jgi:hypothetical protein
MIGDASFEDMLMLWASSLRDAKQRIRPLFARERVAEAHLMQNDCNCQESRGLSTPATF